MPAEMSPMDTPCASSPGTLYRHADAIFCDDLRREDTGKMLIIGMYGPSLMVKEAPTLLPALTIFVRAKSPGEQPFGRFTLRVWLDEEVIHEASVPDEDISAMAAGMGPEEIAAGLTHQIQSIVRLVPFPVMKPGTLRVRLETESGILRAGALKIEVQP